MDSYNWILSTIEKIKQKKAIKIEQKFSFLTDIISEKEKKINGKIEGLYEAIDKNKSEIINELSIVNKSIELIDNNIKKLQLDIGENRIIEEDRKEDMKFAIKKLEQIDKSVLESEKQLAVILLKKSDYLASSVEDVKSLVKLLAVNELVDSIDISAINK